jgi:hypothetical protein
MGSYISIHNDTQDDWYCKVGPDKAALQVFKYISTAVAALALIVSTAGAASGAVLGALVAVGVGKGTVALAGLTLEGWAAITAAAGAANTTRNGIDKL